MDASEDVINQNVKMSYGILIIQHEYMSEHHQVSLPYKQATTSSLNKHILTADFANLHKSKTNQQNSSDFKVV